MQRATMSLLDFIAEGNLSGMKKLVEDGKKRKWGNGLLDMVDFEGWTMLHRVAFCGHPPLAKWLLSSEEDGGRAAGFTLVLGRTSKQRLTALHFAAMQGHLECCQAIVEGCKTENGERHELLNGVDNKGRTALHYAVQQGHPSVVRWFLSSEEGGGRAAGFNMVLAKDQQSCTAMHIAALSGAVECCQALVEGSKNEERDELFNSVDINKFTPFHAAAEAGQPLFIKWLLSAEGGRAVGFDGVLARGQNEFTALHLAAWNGHLECCQALVEGCNVDDGEQEELLNAVDVNGFTALYIAAENNRPHVIQWLLSDAEGGGRALGFTSSSVTATGIYYFTVLNAAVRNNFVEAVNAILSGCTVYERLLLFLTVDVCGWTVLHAAVRLCHANMIRELLLHHPETQTIVDARDNAGMTALHRAVIGGIDEKSRKEWPFQGNIKNFGKIAVIAALLTTPSNGDEVDEQAAQINPNLGTEIE